MEVTLAGMVTLVSPVQPENVKGLMEVTLAGMVTLVSPVQLENAELPMEVTGRPTISAGTATSPTALRG